MGKEYRVMYWIPVSGWCDFWEGDDWDEMVKQLKEVKEQYVCVKMEWRQL